MVHRIVWRVPSAASLDAWAERLGDAGTAGRREDGALVSSDPEGLGIELVVAEEADGAPRAAWAPDIPAEHALAGIAGVRIHSTAPEATERLLVDGLGFTAEGPGRFVTRGAERRGTLWLDPRRPSAASPARAPCTTWRGRRATRITLTGRAARRRRAAHPTGIIDRQYFHSIYFHEPGRVLFEIATVSPGFAVDEEPDRLGEELRVPPQYEAYRERIEERLVPLTNPRTEVTR